MPPVSLEKPTLQTVPEDALRNVKVVLSWSAKKDSLYGVFDLDVSAFLLNAENKVVNNNGFVFYGNTKSPCGSIHHSGDDTTGDKDETITASLSTLPAEIHKVLFVVSIHGGTDIGQVFGKMDEAVVRFLDADNEDEEFAQFNLDDAQSERTVLVGLLKRSGEHWAWKILGNGGNAPLKSIAQKYGVDTKEVRLFKAPPDSPKFDFWCRHCGAKLAAKEKDVGRSNTCPKCKKSVLIERNQPPVRSVEDEITEEEVVRYIEDAEEEEWEHERLAEAHRRREERHRQEELTRKAKAEHLGRSSDIFEIICRCIGLVIGVGIGGVIDGVIGATGGVFGRVIGGIIGGVIGGYYAVIGGGICRIIGLVIGAVIAIFGLGIGLGIGLVIGGEMGGEMGGGIGGFIGGGIGLVIGGYIGGIDGIDG